MITAASDYQFDDLDQEQSGFERFRRGRQAIMPTRAGGAVNRSRSRAAFASQAKLRETWLDFTPSEQEVSVYVVHPPVSAGFSRHPPFCFLPLACAEVLDLALVIPREHALSTWQPIASATGLVFPRDDVLARSKTLGHHLESVRSSDASLQIVERRYESMGGNQL